jgi:hypothetical protein
MLMRLTVLIAFLAAAGLAPAVTAAQEAPSQKTIECALDPKCTKYCWVNGAESAMPWVLLRSSPDYRHAVVSQHAGVRC